MEAAWGQNNLGGVLSYLDDNNQALAHFHEALILFEYARKLEPGNEEIPIEIANALGGRAGELYMLQRYGEALDTRRQEIEILTKLQRTGDVSREERLVLAELSYWHVKNTIQERCNLAEPLKLFRSHKSLQDIDPTNLAWKTDYAAYWSEFITLCQKDIPRDKLEIYRKALLQFAKKNELQDNLYIKELRRLGAAP